MDEATEPYHRHIQLADVGKPLPVLHMWARCGVAIRMPTLHAAAGSAGLAGGVAVAR